ncbi:MAG: hypothetical protein GF328_04010, partial [Candidatus Latescibacteria bacterium]|nr:hypothetical protein [Candidatus Latescibacterota bacterium]
MSNGARAILCVLLLSAGSSAAPGSEEYERGLKAADAALEKLVDDALARGARWLLEQQNPDGSFAPPIAGGFALGVSALPTLALLHAGVPRERETILRAFAALRRLYRQGPKRTYSVSITIMALAEYGRVRSSV